MSERFSLGLRRKSYPITRSPKRSTRLMIEALEDRCVPSVSPSLFESNDGNLVVNGGGGASDWATAANLNIGVDLATGQSDDSFGQGSKENDPVPTPVTGSIPNNKSDLTRFYVANEGVGNQVFMYLAWQRANTLGTANIDFEFNQSETISANGVTPIRTAGDILITFDFSSGGNQVNLGLRTWTGSAWSDSTDLDAAGYADGAVNNGFTVVDPITGATLADRTFGEAAINLTAAGVFPEEECIHFGHAFVKSRSSDSFTAEMKDFIAPIAVNIDNCPDVSVLKTADDDTINAGDVAGFTITVTNLGPVAANNVSFDDTLPAGVDWTIESQNGGFSIAGGILSFDAATLANGETRTVHIVGLTDAEDCGVLTNTVTVFADHEEETDLENNTSSAAITVECPDVAVIKVADDDVISAGDQAGFTITVSNIGEGDAYDVSFDDALPANVSWSIESQSGGFSIAGSVLSFDAAVLASGASRTVHVVGVTDAEDCGELPNTVTVSATNEASDHLGNNTSSDTITVLCPDVAITKVADDSVINAGDQAGFTITVTNTGAGNAYDVSFDDTLPSGISWTIESQSGGFSIAGGVLSFDAAVLASGATRTVHVVGLTDAEDCGILTNTVTVGASNEADDHLGNNTASDTIDVQCPDVTVLKIADDDVVNAGDGVGFTITISNIGEGTAYGVTLSDTLPPDFTWQIDSGPGTIVGGVLSANLGDMAPGASVDIHISAVSDAEDGGLHTNTAIVAATNEASEHTDNNTSTDDFTVLTPDVAVVKVADDAVVSAGDGVGFTITISNLGAGTAYDVTLSDALPAGFAWQIDSGPGAIAGGVLSADLGDLASGATVSIHISAVSDATDRGLHTNTAVVAADNESTSVTDNNTSTDDFTVLTPDVAVVKVADAAVVNATDGIGFTITVSNIGAGNAYDVSFDDTLPGDVNWAIESQSGGFALAGGVLSFDAAVLASGATRTVHIVAATDAEDCGVLTNTVTIDASNEHGDDLGNNTSSATITVECPDVTVLKVADDDVVSAGDGVGFTITISNIGEGTAYDVTLSDTLPSGFTWQIDSGPGSIVDGVLSANLGNMASGASVAIHISAVSDAEDGGLHTNTAVVAAGNEASEHTDNNTSTDDFTVLTPDVHVSKTVGDTGMTTGEVDQGQLAVFTITVSNDGAGNAYDVILADQLPDHVTWTEDSPDAQILNGILIGEFGTLAPGESRTFHVSGLTHVEPPGIGTDCELRNEVFVGASNEPEADMNDNRGAAVILLNPVVTQADLDWLAGGNPVIIPPPAPTASGPFEIDGNLIVDTAGNADWANAPALAIGVDLPTGQTDDSFGQGSKENTAVPTVVNGSIPNNKSDLTRFYVASEVDDNNDVQLFLAWQRANTLGTANIDFEFNQSDVISANGVTPVRTVGDMLITFDFSSGGNVVNLGFRSWLASGEWSASIDLDASGYATGAVNDGFTVVDPITGATLADKTFGEAAINLTDSGVFPPDECIHFGSAFVKSRSSDSFQAELKDFIAPIPVNIDNCPDVHVTKTVGDTGSNIATITAGDTIEFTLVVSNDGMGPATNVTLTDVLAAGIVWSEDSEFAEIIDGVLYASFGTMESGESFTIHLTGLTTEDMCGTIFNEASVSADNEEIEDQDDNLGRALIVIQPALTQDALEYLATMIDAATLRQTLEALFELAQED